MAKNTSTNKKDVNKKRLIIGSAIVAALLASILFTFGYFYIKDIFKNEDVEVPNFVGLSVEEAENEAKQTGVKLDIETQYDKDAPEGEVIKQMTSVGMKVRKGFIVKITVSAGNKLTLVPDLIYKNISDADFLLKDSKLIKGEVDPQFSDLPEGTIIDQNPKKGIEVAQDTVVNLVVSKGLEIVPVNMPNLVGKTLEEGEVIIEQYNLKLGTVDTEFSNQFVKGYIMEQNIEANTETSQGAVVNLIVSKGSDVPEQMEDLEDDYLDENDLDEKQEELSTQTINLRLDGHEGTVEIEVYEINGTKKKRVFKKKHNIDTEGNIVRVPLTGSGKQQYSIYIDGEQEKIQEIVF